MDLKWPELQEKVEREWIKRESQRRKDLGLERPKKLGFGLHSLLSIRRGCLLPQAKLEAVADVISLDNQGKPIPIPIAWQMLHWREGFVRK
jgi:hypothetical protein